MKFENTEVMNFVGALRGMRNPMNSWEKSDSGICKGGDNGIRCEYCSEQEKCKHTYDNKYKIGKHNRNPEKQEINYISHNLVFWL